MSRLFGDMSRDMSRFGDMSHKDMSFVPLHLSFESGYFKKAIYDEQTENVMSRKN